MSLRQWLDNPQSDAEWKKPFVGRVGQGRFTLQRALPGRRGYDVIVEGRIAKGPAGSELQIVVRMAVPQIVLVIGWVSVVVAMAATGAAGAVVSGLLGLFGVGLAVFSFHWDARATMESLHAAFPGSILCKNAPR